MVPLWVQMTSPRADGLVVSVDALVAAGAPAGVADEAPEHALGVVPGMGLDPAGGFGEAELPRQVRNHRLVQHVGEAAAAHRQDALQHRRRNAHPGHVPACRVSLL